MPTHWPYKRLHLALALTQSTFGAAIPLFDGMIERVDIPYEGTSLFGYLYRPVGAAGWGGDASKPRPTLIMPGGGDSFAEENYMFGK